MTEVDNLLQRMTIVGVILCFRQLGQEALNDVLNQRVPFLLSSIIDFKEHFPADEADATVVNEMASAAGLSCVVDPVLVTALKMQRTGQLVSSFPVSSLVVMLNCIPVCRDERR